MLLVRSRIVVQHRQLRLTPPGTGKGYLTRVERRILGCKGGNLSKWWGEEKEEGKASHQDIYGCRHTRPGMRLASGLEGFAWGSMFLVWLRLDPGALRTGQHVSTWEDDGSLTRFDLTFSKTIWSFTLLDTMINQPLGSVPLDTHNDAQMLLYVVQRHAVRLIKGWVSRLIIIRISYHRASSHHSVYICIYRQPAQLLGTCIASHALWVYKVGISDVTKLPRTGYCLTGAASCGQPIYLPSSRRCDCQDPRSRVPRPPDGTDWIAGCVHTYVH